MNLNRFEGVGNAVRDPELRFTAGGAAVCSFGLALNERRFNRDTSEWEDGDTTFVDVTCWRSLAENVAETVQKGTRVVVIGKLRTERWEDRETGDPRSKLSVVADVVAPDLTWATADVQKSDNRGGGGGGGRPARSSGGGGRQASSAGQYDDDEQEPF